MNNPKNNVFLSWSGSKSNAIAFVFNSFLPYFIQAVKPFFSPLGIEKDSVWFNKIKEELISSQTGIIFLTEENYNAPWILFEAGGLFSKDSTCVLLCDIDVNFLKKNDSIFQYFNVTKISDKNELKKLIFTLNNKISPEVDRIIIEDAFDSKYLKFRDELDMTIKNSVEKYEFPNNIIGRWILTYRKLDETKENTEIVNIKDNGNYYIEDNGKEELCFKLNILKNNNPNIIWQKIKSGKDLNIQDVHSIENLRHKNNELVGLDTIGYELNYQKL